MPTPLPKPPTTAKSLGREMFLWVNRVYTRLSEVGGIVWVSIDFTGSNLTDLATRNHAGLQNIGLADDTSTDATQDKHISNLQAKTWTDNDAKTVDETDTNTTKDKHVSNNLAKGWEDTKTNYTAHASATSAHGATGNLIGTGNAATTGTRGAVYQASASTDAAASSVSASSSTVSVTSADISVAPATYNATWGGEVETLGNELKTDLNQLKTDLNSAITQLNQLVTDVNAIKDSLNDLKAKQRSSGQLGI